MPFPGTPVHHLMEQPLNFYQLDVVPATWPVTSKHYTRHNTDLCSCGETQTMSHIVESCPLTKLNGGLSQLYSADDDAIAWLTNYGS